MMIRRLNDILRNLNTKKNSVIPIFFLCNTYSHVKQIYETIYEQKGTNIDWNDNYPSCV